MENISMALVKSTGIWMDVLQIVLVIVVVVGLSYLLRRRRGASNKLEVAIQLIGDLRYNQKMLSQFSVNAQKMKKLKTGAWMRNYDRITFLDEQTCNHITHACKLTQEYNACVDIAREKNSPEYLTSISVDVLVESLDKSRAGLAVWIRDNYMKEMPVRRSFLGF